TKRVTRNPRRSMEKVLGAAAMILTRRATCAVNAATPVRKKSQKTAVEIMTRTQRTSRTQRSPSLWPLRAFVSLSRFQSIDERRHDLEQIADDAVVRNLEDRRVGILVDGNDRVGAFHTDQMLNGAGDSEREVELWRNRLTRASDLSLHRQPAGI